MNLPKKRSARFTERITLPITKETKLKLVSLKNQGVDFSEWIRQMIDQGISGIEGKKGAK